MLPPTGVCAEYQPPTPGSAARTLPTPGGAGAGAAMLGLGSLLHKSDEPHLDCGFGEVLETRAK